ncbi:MAG TPA: hypothetical protein VLO10_00275 [Candidatus Deferrimicrobium sp.]|nr:hypothetical protein [Candidatus Deferrimicrobium sp.]
MGSCACVPPSQLHLRPDGVHLPDGSAATVVVVDEVWADGPPRCSICGAGIEDTFYQCVPCESVMCRRCLAASTAVVECDCIAEVAVNGVQLAARRATATQLG